MICSSMSTQASAVVAFLFYFFHPEIDFQQFWCFGAMFGLFRLAWNPAAALPHEVLEKDFYVPNSGSRSDAYKGCKMLQDICQPTADSVMMFFNRTTQAKREVFVVHAVLNLVFKVAVPGMTHLPCTARTLSEWCPRSQVSKPRSLCCFFL